MSTIKDVARLAGVSPATVSRITSGATNVNPETRKRVLDVIQQLSYSPNSAARALAMRRTGAVGILLNRMEDPFYYDLIRGFSDGSTHNDITAVFCTYKDRDTQNHYVDYLTNGVIDGIIIYGSYFLDKEIILRLEGMRFPLLVIESPFDDFPSNRILIDNYGGVFQAVEYLAQLGHNRIAFIGGNVNKRNSIERSDGYFSAMQKYGLPIRRDYVHNLYDDDYSAGFDSMKQILALGKEKPTAVVCGDDAIASYAILAAQQEGIRVPDDISVIGIDDQKIMPFKYTGPDITTLRQPLYEIGFESIGILKSCIEQKSGDSPSVKVYKTELLVHESVAPPSLE